MLLYRVRSILLKGRIRVFIIRKLRLFLCSVILFMFIVLIVWLDLLHNKFVKN